LIRLPGWQPDRHYGAAKRWVSAALTKRRRFSRPWGHNSVRSAWCAWWNPGKAGRNGVSCWTWVAPPDQFGW